MTADARRGAAAAPTSPRTARATSRPPRPASSTADRAVERRRNPGTSAGRAAPSSRAASGRRRATTGLERTALRELTTILAAGAAVVSVATLVLLPGLPSGVALAMGVVVSATVGAGALAVWGRRADRGAAGPAPTRPQAVAAVVGAHAVAAVPIGLAVLLAT